MAKPEEKGPPPDKGKPDKDQGPPAASLELVMVQDNNGDGKPNYNDIITFKVTMAKPGDTWWQLNTVIRQDNNVVGSHNTLPGPDGQPSLPMSLYSRSWTGGAAEGVAELYGMSQEVIATLAFHVEA